MFENKKSIMMELCCGKKVLFIYLFFLILCCGKKVKLKFKKKKNSAM